MRQKVDYLREINQIYNAYSLFLWFQLIFYSRSEYFLLADRMVSTCNQKHFCLQVETLISLSTQGKRIIKSHKKDVLIIHVSTDDTLANIRFSDNSK